MIIYKLTNKVNGKAYVGQTRQKLSLRIYKHSIAKSVIGGAIRKYGLDSFIVETICETNCQDQLDILEIEEIRRAGSLVPNGYNIQHGGRHYATEYKHSSETINKIKKANIGKKLTAEHIAKVVAKTTGQKRSIETKVKLKMSQPTRKSIRCSNGKIYNSITEAGKDLGVSPSNISQVLKGKRSQANGFTFEVINGC